MISSLTNDARADLDDALASVGVSWPWLQQVSWEIVLFGSRAIEGQTAGSDWDLLCVGGGRSRRTRRIDLIWISPEDTDSPAWLTSELAGHIAAYGRWLAGTSTWPARVTTGAEAAKQKERWLAAKTRAWQQCWRYCSSRLRRRYARDLRRNLQRHALLSTGRPVPPSPVLDLDWASGRTSSETDERLRALARSAGICTEFFTESLLPLMVSEEQVSRPIRQQ